MRFALYRFRMLSIVSLGAMVFVFGAIAQTKKPQSDRKTNSPQAETEKNDQQDISIKFDTDLVTVPVIASNRSGVYVHDLTREDFTVHEDGVKQEIEFFTTVRTPFRVVLMLDSSASAEDKLPRIQRAARTFLEQLQPADRIKIISFDDGVHDLSQFTSDRDALNNAIDSVKPGKGTKLYDAVKYALYDLSRLKERKAIVIFTDGVDWRSDTTDYDDNIRQLEESSVIVYPIRYDTRYETEALIRRQQERGETVDLGEIFGGSGNPVPPIATPPAIPGGSRTPAPSGRGGGTETIERPMPPVIIEQGRYPGGRFPGGSQYPTVRFPPDQYPNRYPPGRPPNRNPDGSGYPDDRNPPDRFPDDRNPDSRNPSRRRDNDGVSVMLDNLYRTADQYLQDLAARSGGELYRADTLGSLPDAFTNIAAELRNMYSLGYYPANQASDGKYRKIQVKVSRKDVVIRARPGYRAPSEGSKVREGKNFVSSPER